MPFANKEMFSRSHLVDFPSCYISHLIVRNCTQSPIPKAVTGKAVRVTTSWGQWTFNLTLDQVGAWPALKHMAIKYTNIKGFCNLKKYECAEERVGGESSGAHPPQQCFWDWSRVPWDVRNFLLNIWELKKNPHCGFPLWLVPEILS